jgi:hypothetical protein
MSALLTPRRPRRGKRPAERRPEGQSSLFAATAAAAPVIAEPEPAVPAEPTEAAVPETFEAPAQPEPAAAAAAAPETFNTASARRQGPTLDDLVAGAWEGLLAGAPADCLVCGTKLAPRHSAGAGIVGGRCGGCGSSLS